MNEWQRRLSFRQVVAQALADGRFVAGVIEYVVDDLEGRADMRAVACQPFLQRWRAARQHCREARRRLEELRGLAPDHLQIARLVDLGVVAAHELHYFPG